MASSYIADTSTAIGRTISATVFPVTTFLTSEATLSRIIALCVTASALFTTAMLAKATVVSGGALRADVFNSSFYACFTMRNSTL